MNSRSTVVHLYERSNGVINRGKGCDDQINGDNTAAFVPSFLDLHKKSVVWNDLSHELQNGIAEIGNSS